jgi:hypothetical protein
MVTGGDLERGASPHLAPEGRSAKGRIVLAIEREGEALLRAGVDLEKGLSRNDQKQVAVRLSLHTLAENGNRTVARSFHPKG